MKSNLQTLLNRKHFFKIITTTNSTIKYTLAEASQILQKNIHINWLQYLNTKTQKVMPVYIENVTKVQEKKLPFGVIKHIETDYKNKVFEHDLNDFTSISKTVLDFTVKIPRDECMRYFTQWQRYRKYWWSSITTTPSLFAIDEIKQGESECDVDIIAKLPDATQPVEHIEIRNDDNPYTSSLSCKMCLEESLSILLLDASYNSDDNYLRLHRTIAPYKISFALNFEDTKDKLQELATILYYRLKLENIEVWLPDFTMSYNDQIRENLLMGVPYTAILSKITLDNGIFHLMNSSTTLKEQVHVADFHSYASLICKAKS